MVSSFRRTARFWCLVDWIYKKLGISDLVPEENAKHVSGYERAYVESHMHTIKNEIDNGMM